MPPGNGWSHPQDLRVQQQRLSFFSSPTSIAYSISSTVLFTSQEKVGRGPCSSARISTATIATHTGVSKGLKILQLEREYLIEILSSLSFFIKSIVGGLKRNFFETFKLQRLTLCIGGIVNIELLERIQKQFTDDRYYIWQMRQLAMAYMLLRPVQFMDEDEADLQM
ncbi:hypothetical protein ZEAMMB73_Zm00001d034336 [Zea mays]|uniref:Uncharacterized protein n=1 Tax=Zea mays TaxID=4577 RepID=A0A1D6L6P5_MAIZE|nr:hypothetical protein ZEAMMB73_Zm00001d034336 [Zea mays]ONM09970.1 hypothetical protein ZEAMMB73_Zm00001d034336 [Zea mays]